MLDNFFSKIDVRTNYNDISRIRSNMHQYGETSSNVSDYDTVDLYELIDKMKNYNNTEALNIENYLKKNVILCPKTIKKFVYSRNSLYFCTRNRSYEEIRANTD